MKFKLKAWMACEITGERFTSLEYSFYAFCALILGSAFWGVFVWMITRPSAYSVLAFVFECLMVWLMVKTTQLRVCNSVAAP